MKKEVKKIAPYRPPTLPRCISDSFSQFALPFICYKDNNVHIFFTEAGIISAYFTTCSSLLQNNNRRHRA